MKFRDRLLEILTQGHRPDLPDNPTFITAKMLEEIEEAHEAEQESKNED